MRIYYKILGGHVHCKVFTEGSKCGDLVFTVKEWDEWIRHTFSTIGTIKLEKET